MLDLGTLRVGIQADSDKAVKSLQSFKGSVETAEKTSKKSAEEIEAATDKVNGAFGKLAGAAAAGAAAIGAAFVGTAKSALDGYSAYEQNVGGIQKLFGTAGQSLEEYAASVGKSVEEAQGDYDRLNSASDTVMRNAKDAWRNAGVSANAYMEQATSFSASLIAGLGGDTVAAAEYANTAIVDMSDNANTFGTNIEDIQHAYQGFAKQNYTMLDNLDLLGAMAA